jgi:hypothetical protein
MQSRFIKLSEYCLLEYQYESLSPASPILITSPFFKLKTSENEIFIYNQDSALYETGNIKDLTTIPMSTDGGRFVYINSENVPNYTEYDTTLTETVVPGGSIIGDRARFYIASGFQFTEFTNMVLSIKQDMNDGNALILASILLNANTIGDILLYTTRPFIIGNTLYDRYIDIIVPSIKNMDEEFYTSINQANTFEYQITNGIGLVKNNPITVNLFECSFGPNISTEDETYTTVDINRAYSAQIAQSNDFDLVGAKIREAVDGDYLEFFATWNQGFPEEFIGILEKRSGQSWIIFHQLTIFEQIGSTFVQSGDATFFQETNFDEPLIFRPILKNANEAVTMVVDYSVRLVNRTTNEQIIRTASLTVVNPNKYGKALLKLDLADKPNSYKISNLVVKKLTDSFQVYSDPSMVKPAPVAVQTAAVAEPTVITNTVTKYVPVFYVRNTIVIAQKNYLVKSGKKSELAYGQGLLNIAITPFDNTFKFQVKTESLNASGASAVTNMDLTQFTGFELVFGSSASKISIANITDQSQVNSDLGEILFKVDATTTAKLQNIDDPKFYIVSVGKDGSRSALYTGKWYKADDITMADSENSKLLSDAIKQEDLSTTITELKARIVELETENINLKVSPVKPIISQASNITQDTPSNGPNPIRSVRPISSGSSGYSSWSTNGGSGGNYGGCPTPSMLVFTGDHSWIKAGDLVKGTEIYTIHEKTGEWGTYLIESAEITIQPVVRVKFGDKMVEVSESHKFLTSLGEYTEISNLGIGSLIETLEGPVEISAIDKIGETEVVRIEVEDAHTYVVEGAISHNKMTMNQNLL